MHQVKDISSLNCTKQVFVISKLQSRSSFGCPGDNSEQVVAKRIAQVGSEVLDWTLSGDVSLDEETEHGEHG